jgi:uncharacterized repeat protein (TIGR03803 family)
MRLRAAGTLLAVALIHSPATVAAQSAGAWTFSVFYGFKGPDGAHPEAGLIRDAAGNFYGTTYAGGSGYGTVFKLDASGKETVLHSFAGFPTDGQFPAAALLRDSSGNLYGTTYQGGTSYQGTVFKVDTTGTETVLYNFTLGTDGGYPVGSLIQDAAGNLYGTTMEGGNLNCGFHGFGCGVVFELDAAGHETVLHSFTNAPDGAYPEANLIMDAAGALYGTTRGGGAANNCGSDGCGTVFKLDVAGKETVLHSFTGLPDGRNPNGGLIRDTKGNFYGTTVEGGIHKTRNCHAVGCGTVFRLDAAGKETVLYTFTGVGGWAPRGAVIRDSVGNLYGTTEEGGVLGACDCGVVFKLDRTGKETVLYKFKGGREGSLAQPGLIRDAAGNLYGTTQTGGPGGGCPIPGSLSLEREGTVYPFSPRLPPSMGGCGEVFKLTP